MLKLFSFNKIFGIIYLILFFVGRIYDLPSYIAAILSISWFLYVPFTIGSIFLEIPLKYLKSINSIIIDIDIAGLILKWIVGIFIISIIMYISFLLHMSIILILGPLLLILSVGFYFIYDPTTSKSTLNLNKYHLRIILIVIVVGISFGSYIRSFSPYPLSPGLDVFNHMYTIKSILNDSVSNSPLVYLPTFDIFIALGSSSFNSDLDSIFWMGSILLCILFALSWYVMSYYFLKNYVLSILGTIISLAFTEMGIASNLQYYFPASFLMSIYPLMFFVIDHLWKKRNKNHLMGITILTLIVYSVLIIMHSYLGIIASVQLSLYIFCVHYLTKKDNLFLLFRLTTVFLALVVLVYYLGYLTFQFQSSVIESNMIESHHLYNTVTKINNLNQWYTEVIMLLSVIGFIVLSFYQEKKIIVLNFIGIITLLIYFQSISDIHRLMPLERSFLSFAATTSISLPFIIIIYKSILRSIFATTIKKLIKKLNSLKKFNNYKNQNQNLNNDQFYSFKTINKLGFITVYKKSPKLLSVYIIIVFILLFPILMKPYDLYIGSYLNKGFDFTNYTQNELSAGKWIQNNIPKNYKVYSDPLTVIEMRGLSNRINIEGIGWNTTLASEVKNNFLSENSAFAYRDILSTQGHNTVIVITPRTSEWVNSHVFFIQFPIKEFREMDGFKKYFDEEYFKLEYRNNSVMVFTLK